MGLRIHKSIGYFLKHSQISQVFVEDYADLIKNMDVVKVIENLEKTTVDNTSTDLELLVQKLKSKKINMNDLIYFVYVDEDKEDLMMNDLYTCKKNHYDDLIDYYEEYQKMENKVRFLHAPIYPCSGYVYVGGLEGYEIGEKLVKGKHYQSYEMNTFAYCIDNEVNNHKTDYNNSQEIKEILTKNKYFHPCVDDMIYEVCKATNLLKEGVTAQNFNVLIEPAIAVYWM